MLKKIEETVNYLKDAGVGSVDVAIILGSGLGELVNDITDAVQIKYENIPNFPVSTVAGHAGELVYGTLGGKKVLAMKGRFHFYEGYPMEQVTFPVRVMKQLGAQSLFLTNAAGGVNTNFKQGCLMLIQDHINFMGTNPLIGKNHDELGPRFPDMSQIYTLDYQEVAKKEAEKLGVNLEAGVYMGFTGPSYETPAEIRMARTLGADAVGMSTVPEAIVAAHMGMKVIGISCITNLAAGMQAELNHEEVVEVTNQVKQGFKQLVTNIVSELN